MQVTVGECHPKKNQCMLGSLQSVFREPTFLPKGGDALIIVGQDEFVKKIGLDCLGMMDRGPWS